MIFHNAFWGYQTKGNMSFHFVCI